MTGFVIKRFVKLLKSKGFRVVKQLDDNQWIVKGHGIYGVIAPAMHKYYGADFFIENDGLWNKFSHVALRVDVSTVVMDDLFADMSFLNTEEGRNYNKRYTYLDDNCGKFKSNIPNIPI